MPYWASERAQLVPGARGHSVESTIVTTAPPSLMWLLVVQTFHRGQ